jgi:hypothetical protein
MASDGVDDTLAELETKLDRHPHQLHQLQQQLGEMSSAPRGRCLPVSILAGCLDLEGASRFAATQSEEGAPAKTRRELAR